MQLQPLERLYKSTEGIVSIVAQVLIAVASVPSIGALKPTVGGITITALGIGQLLQRGLIKSKALDVEVAKVHASALVSPSAVLAAPSSAEPQLFELDRDVAVNALAAHPVEEQPLVPELQDQAVQA